MLPESVALLVIAATVTHVGRELRALSGEQRLLDGNIGVFRQIVDRLQKSNDRFACIRTVARIRSEANWRLDAWETPISDSVDVG